jgi:nucleotide-binding universal stress UspA family protein
MQSILIATDGSPGSDAAVADGIELAREAGAKVTVVSVRPPIALLGEPYHHRKLSEQLQAARAAVDRAMAAAADDGVGAEAEILEGEVAKEVLRLARSRNVDLIVIGSRGLGAVTGVLLGSVSRAVVRDADRPVLVVKEPTRTKEASTSAERVVSAP